MDKNTTLENIINSCNFGEPPTLKILAESLGVSERTVKNRINEHGGYWIDKNSSCILKKKEGE